MAYSVSLTDRVDFGAESVALTSEFEVGRVGSWNQATIEPHSESQIPTSSDLSCSVLVLIPIPRPISYCGLPLSRRRFIISRARHTVPHCAALRVPGAALWLLPIADLLVPARLQTSRLRVSVDDVRREGGGRRLSTGRRRQEGGRQARSHVRHTTHHLTAGHQQQMGWRTEQRTELSLTVLLLPWRVGFVCAVATCNKLFTAHSPCPHPRMTRSKSATQPTQYTTHHTHTRSTLRSRDGTRITCN